VAITNKVLKFSKLFCQHHDQSFILSVHQHICRVWYMLLPVCPSVCPLFKNVGRGLRDDVKGTEVAPQSHPAPRFKG